MAEQPGETAGDVTWRLHPPKRSVVVAVVRRLIPTLIEATLIPTVLFYVVVARFDGTQALARQRLAEDLQSQVGDGTLVFVELEVHGRNP